MNPRSRIILLAAAIVITVCAGIYMFLDSAGTGSKVIPNKEAVVTKEQAVEIALETTEVSRKKTTVSKRELTYKDGLPQYRIEFSSASDRNEIQFVCIIDGMTGDVINVRKTVSSRASTSNKDTKAKDKNAYEDPDQFIGVDEIKKIVLSDTGLDEDETTFRSVRLRNRNEIMVYVAEFSSAEVDYKFFVDAVSGQVIERRVEYDDE